jgi:UrcA family protein
MLKTFSAAAAVLVTSALVTPTVSQAQETRSARVSYADLNLASSAGQGQLQRRIAFAARSVCDDGGYTDLAMMAAVLSCRNAAVADAQPAYEAAVASARHGTVEVLGSAAIIVAAHARG